MATNILDGDVRTTGEHSAGSLVSESASLTNAMFSSAASARLVAEKVVHRFALDYRQNNGAAIAAATVPLHICRGTATAIQLKGAITGVVPTGADTVTVDIQKSTGAGAFATIMSATMQFSVASVLRTVVNSTSFSSTSFAAGDIIAVVVTVSGSSGQGLMVTLEIDELPS